METDGTSETVCFCDCSFFGASSNARGSQATDNDRRCHSPRAGSKFQESQERDLPDLDTPVLASYTSLYIRQWTRMTDSRHAPDPRKNHAEKPRLGAHFYGRENAFRGGRERRKKDYLTQRTHKCLKTKTNLGNEPKRTHRKNLPFPCNLLNLKEKTRHFSDSPDIFYGINNIQGYHCGRTQIRRKSGREKPLANARPSLPISGYSPGLWRPLRSKAGAAGGFTPLGRKIEIAATREMLACYTPGCPVCRPRRFAL